MKNISDKEWVQARLTTTLQRYLSGLLNQEISVVFFCSEKEKIKENNTLPHPEEELATLELDVLYGSVRDYLLEAGRVVKFPIYYFRWLPYVQSQVLFLVMAFWQEYYLSSAGKPKGNKAKVSARAEKICQWAGISRAQYFRYLQPGSELEWFIRKIETDYELDDFTGRTKKSANKYLLLDTPLTPGDAEDLRNFLIVRRIKDSPKEALQTAIEVEPKEILTYPYRQPPENFSEMREDYITVQGIVRGLIAQKPDAELDMLADQLADRLLAKSDFILVSWYFLKNWLPVLGADAAMFVLILRNLCYFNDETGVLRDEVWIDGGYEALAQRLGIANPRKIATWFPAKTRRRNGKEVHTPKSQQELSRRKNLQDQLGLFVKRTDHRLNSSGNYAWMFKVQRRDSLTLEHEQILQKIYSLFERSEKLDVMNELFAWLDGLPEDWNETLKLDTKIVFGLSKKCTTCSETLKSIFADCFETLDWRDKDCFETLLKILKFFKDSYKNKDTLSNPENTEPEQKSCSTNNSRESWLFEKLLRRVDKKNREVLLAQETGPLPFVSWVIYGASQASIQNPCSLAITKLKESPGVSAGGACDRLAALAPDKLASLIQQSFGWDTPSDPNWRVLFTHVNQERLLLLADQLSLDIKIELDL